MRKSKVVLSTISMMLDSDGNISVAYETVPRKGVKEALDDELERETGEPYQNTYVVLRAMELLEEAFDTLNKTLQKELPAI